MKREPAGTGTSSPSADPDEYKKSLNPGGTPGAVVRPVTPPTLSRTNGVAMANPPSITTSCSSVHPRRAEQAAGGEVDRHDERAGDDARRPRGAGDRRQNRGAGDQLAGENRQRPEPDQHRHDPADGASVAKLEVVAGRVEVVLCRDLPDARTDPERERQRADAGRPVPPPRADPVAIAEPAAPTVVPAPMLAASIVENRSGADSLRPATKKSALPRTARDIQRPSAMNATE